MAEALPAAVELVATALRARGSSAEPFILAAPARTAAEAASALDCEIGAIANSLVFLCDDRPLLVMTSGAHRVNTTALAARLGRSSIVRATPEQVKAATGQVIGGVAPLGHPTQLETIVDRELAAFPKLWAAAGIAHSIVSLTFDELVSVTDGLVADVD